MGRIITGLLLMATLSAQTATAETLPPIFANLPASENEDANTKAMEHRVRAAFPRDIGSGTLAKLMELDGFEVDETDDGVRASFQEAEFPCITDYVVIWAESEIGAVADLNVERHQKCF